MLDLLHDLTAYAVDLGQVTSAGVTVLDEGGHVDYLTASDEVCARLEEDQLDLDEGPCVDAARTGSMLQPVVLEPSGPALDRWPRFTPRAVAAGFTCVAAVPLRIRGLSLGSLNLLQAGPDTISHEDLQLAQLLADATGSRLHHRQTLLARDEVIAQLTTALQSRIVIEQAKGMLAARLGTDAEDAFQRMRALARSQQRKLIDLARQIAQGTSRPRSTGRADMPGNTADTGPIDAPPPREDLTRVLTRAHQAVRAGDGPASALPADIAALFGLDALTLNALTQDGLPELLWADPVQGPGVNLDAFQYSVGDGPTWQAAQQGRMVLETDLDTVEPARWPLFLTAAADADIRAIVAHPLQVGSATVAVLTGYRTTPGPLTPDHIVALNHLARILLLAMITQFTLPANGTIADDGLRLHHAEVHQATGYLAGALGISVGEALLRLRAHAAADGPISDLARGFLTRRLSPDTLQA
ncbi:GAF domain-containing protein [Streptomyces sp. cg28]|uniref:GAF domain-containing protein n=1 Tax=Streptomyces sp. cg28 TaxID=3403457 RepID=UPI003B2244F7